MIDRLNLLHSVSAPREGEARERERELEAQVV